MSDRAPAAEEEIMRFCRAWTDAIRDRDDDTMNQLMADDFTFTSERGRWGKAQFVENTRRWQLVGMEFQDLLVRQYGPVTVMQARVALRAHLDGQEMSGESYLTDIWVNRGASWQVVARQWSRSSGLTGTPVGKTPR
jgi:ketosteroid isomerase-like protein